MSIVALEELEGLDAEAAFARLAERPGAYWLDNAFRAVPVLSAMGAEPAFVLSWDADRGLRTEPVQPAWLPPELPPLEALRRVTALTDLPRDLPNRQHADAGNAGYVGYEIASHIEPRVPGWHREPSVPGWHPEPSFPTVYWAWYARHLTQTTADGRLRAVAVDWPLWERLGLRLPPPAVRVRELLADLRLVKPTLLSAPPVSDLGLPVGEFDRAEYGAAVARVIEYIRAGDIFQANLSQRFRGPRPMANPALYRRLRSLNRAPHSAYLALVGSPASSDSVADAPTVLSASPELFLSVDADGHILTRPIKGTRPRGADVDADRRLAAELAASPKDTAELVMIVDLLRNDLGRVCRYGSVQVTAARELESFATVHHMVASVVGQLRPERDRFDLLTASLPGGSITGAPKVRAMQILRELERSPRGVYTGCVGRFGSGTELDLNIAIRTLMSAAGRVSFGVGGGVVADSDPDAEYQETLHKAAGMLRALQSVVNSSDTLGHAAGAGV